jgi:hypothetical protein
MSREASLCKLNFTSETISTWRAQGFANAQSERIARHIPTCAACQEHLAAYDAMDAVLQAHRAPHWNSDWVDLERRIRQARRVARPGNPLSPTVLKGWMTVAAAVLLVIGFVAIFYQHRSPMPTATILKPAAMTTHSPVQVANDPWEQITPPAPSGWLLSYAASPNDPSTLFVCGVSPAPPSPGAVSKSTFGLWRTSDSGQHWLKSALPANIGGRECEIQIAEDAPERIVVLVEHTSPPQVVCGDYDLLLSTDNGDTWNVGTNFAPPLQSVRSCSHDIWATRHHVFVYTTYVQSESTSSSVLARSDNDASTWNPVNDTPAPGHLNKPVVLGDGETMVVTQPSANIDAQNSGTVIWQTHDAGASWQQITVTQGYQVSSLLTEPHSNSLTPFSTAHATYLLNQSPAPWYLFRVQIAQVSSATRYSFLPPLPVGGASNASLGVTSILTEAPSGELFVFAVGMQDGIPDLTKPFPPQQFTQQWLWAWDPRHAKWEAFTRPLPETWPGFSASSPGCADHCWWSAISVSTKTTSDTYLWVASRTHVYRLHLPSTR